MRKSIHLLVPLFFVLTNPFMTFSQTCDSLVPYFVVDLSSDSDSLWVSPPIQRAGFCCGAISETCIEFDVTISPTAVGVVVYIYSSQVQFGSVYTKTNCTDQALVGDTLFFTTSGPHSVTICKPGNNMYQYGIKSIPDLNTIVLNYEKNYSIIIYPNPTSDYIVLKPEFLKIITYNIMDVSGKIIKTADFDKSQKINLEFLTQGFYLMELLGDNQAIRLKILKQ